ncbi:MAG TPA: heme-binding protein, partial [Myxococcota bacterium]
MTTANLSAVPQPSASPSSPPPSSASSTIAPRPSVGARASANARVLSRVTAVAPIATAGAGAALLWRGRRALGFSLLGASGLFALARWQLGRFVSEQTPYTVEARIGPLEIRRYAAAVRAETVVDAQVWQDALAEGFRRLARYIFGGRARIAMTAPVTATVGAQQATKRIVTFTMPA